MSEEDKKLLIGLLAHKKLIPKPVFVELYSQSYYARLAKDIENHKLWKNMIVNVGKKAFVNIELFEDYLITNNERYNSFREEKLKKLGVIK